MDADTGAPSPPRRRSMSPAPRGSARDAYADDPPARDSHNDRSYRDRGPPPSRGGGGRFENPDPSNVIGVFGLSMDTREADLEDLFDRVGKTEKVTIVYDQRSHQSRGFGFVQMAGVEDAEKVIAEYNGYELHGRRMRVDFSKTKRPHEPTPGQYMGFKDARGPPRGGDRYGYSRDPYPPRRRYDDRYDSRDRYDRYDDRRSRRRSPRYDDDRRPSRYDDYDDRRPPRYADDYDSSSRGPGAVAASRDRRRGPADEDDAYGVPAPGPLEREPYGRRSSREASPPPSRDLADAPAHPSRDMY